MPTPITNAQAIAFCNNNLRPMADTLKQAYYQALEIQNTWNSGVSALFTNDSSPVEDSATVAPQDGRPPIVGTNVFNLITQCENLVTLYQANSNAILNVVTEVAVNGQSKF